MTELEVLLATREKLARVEINRICGIDHAEKLLGEDVLRIFDAMATTLPTACPYLRIGEYSGDGHRWTHCQLAEQQRRVAEAARAFADVTLGLENTVEGAALLAALEAMNDRNTIR